MFQNRFHQRPGYFPGPLHPLGKYSIFEKTDEEVLYQ